MAKRCGPGEEEAPPAERALPKGGASRESAPPVPKPRSGLTRAGDGRPDVDPSKKEEAGDDEEATQFVSEYRASFKDPEAYGGKTSGEKDLDLDLDLDDGQDSDSENQSQDKRSSALENAGYISDSGDVEHYISDSEIEDRVPQIRDRQMSVFQPALPLKKTIYERSLSLPTEDLYEVSAQSVMLRKKYFEEQMKKDIVEGELIAELEEQSPERKNLLAALVETDAPAKSNGDVLRRERDDEEESLGGGGGDGGSFEEAVAQKTDDVINKLNRSIREAQMELEETSEIGSVPSETYARGSAEEIPAFPMEEGEDSPAESRIVLTHKTEPSQAHKSLMDSSQTHKHEGSVRDRAVKLSAGEATLLDDAASKAKPDDDGDSGDVETHKATKTPIDRSTKSLEHFRAELLVDKSETEESEKKSQEDSARALDSHRKAGERGPSPVNRPTQRIEDTVWEVPVQSQAEERVAELATDDRRCRGKEEEFGGDGEEPRSEDRSDIQKVLLESLQSQKFSSEEATLIAGQLIDDIEAEIQNGRATVEEDEEPNPKERREDQISDFVRELAEAKGLDSREVQLVQSVLLRKQRELNKLRRDDTQASSVEITDEDLRYSGAEVGAESEGYEPVLEEQIRHLKIEKDMRCPPRECPDGGGEELERMEERLDAPEGGRANVNETIMEEDESGATRLNSDEEKFNAEDGIKEEHDDAGEGEVKAKEDSEGSRSSREDGSSRRRPEGKSEDVVMRKTKRESGTSSSNSSSNLKPERRSGADAEAYSSSGESHYQSFELDSGRSRPESSDVEGMLAAGSSEYESALTSQDASVPGYVTSTEYHTAISSLSSKESMKSLDSESSGHLASVEISEASETLVPSTFELDNDILEDVVDDDGANPELRSGSEDSRPRMLISDGEETSGRQDVPGKMKRSYEMTFQPEPKVLSSDSPQDSEDRLAASLEDGSVLSVSLSSTSSATALKTVLEVSQAEQDRPEGGAGGMNASCTSEDLSASTQTQHSSDLTVDSVTMTTSSDRESPGRNVATQITTSSQSAGEEAAAAGEGAEDCSKPTRRGHKRTESSTFGGGGVAFAGNLEDDRLSRKEVKSYERKDVDEVEKDAKDGEQKKPSRAEKRDPHAAGDKAGIEEAEADAVFSMVAHVSPVHKSKQFCPIMEDEAAEKHELETRERTSKEAEIRRQRARDLASGAIPDIKVTQHMAPLSDTGFRHPEIDLEEEEEEETQTPQTPASNSSRSSEETDQGREYVLEDSRTGILEEPTTESQSTVLEKTTREEETDSPDSDSFEMLEKPDLIDDFVVIEEVAKEAHEHDSEGKSVRIKPTKRGARRHDEEVEGFIAESTAASQKRQEPKKSDDLDFEFEISPPKDGDGEEAEDHMCRYDRELQANKKWMEQQFQGDQATVMAAGYGYEVEFERGPLEDIKEEDVTDFESSRIGSLGSQKESGGSLGSVKDSFSSTPEYDVLAGRRCFARSSDHDDVSMSSLQEFENLERVISLENRKHQPGSLDSSNGSLRRHCAAGRSGQGDDVSVSSLKEFEGLERACIAAHKIEVKVKEEEALLAQIEEGQESIASETESCETMTGTTDRKLIPDSDEEDYERRIFEIDEIIRQAQSNVEKFINLKETIDNNESLGRGDSFEEVSKVPDLELDVPTGERNKMVKEESLDSLEQKRARDLMTASTDSIEFQARQAVDPECIMTDSIEGVEQFDRVGMVTSDSLELPGSDGNRGPLSDSIDEDGSRIYVCSRDVSSCSTKEDAAQEEEVRDFQSECVLESCDSFDPTSSSAATHATYQYETDSVFSGSFTSGGSNTMVSSTDTIDPSAAQTVDVAAAVQKVWFDLDPAGRLPAGDAYVAEVLEPLGEDGSAQTARRRVEYGDGKCTKTIYSHRLDGKTLQQEDAASSVKSLLTSIAADSAGLFVQYLSPLTNRKSHCCRISVSFSLFFIVFNCGKCRCNFFLFLCSTSSSLREEIS